MEKLARSVCRQVAAVIASSPKPFSSPPHGLPKAGAQLNGGDLFGPGGVVIEQLVLVSIKRVSFGCWVPCLRLVADYTWVPLHEPPPVEVIRWLIIFSVTPNNLRAVTACVLYMRPRVVSFRVHAATIRGFVSSCQKLTHKHFRPILRALTSLLSGWWVAIGFESR